MSAGVTSRPVSALRNLGPRSEAVFARAGIASAEALIAMGPDAAYGALLDTGVRPHFSFYWAICLGIEGRHWLSTGPEEKAALRARHDAIIAGRRTAPASALEAALDRLGVRDQPTSSRPAKK